jgi:hypothetical protein
VTAGIAAKAHERAGPADHLTVATQAAIVQFDRFHRHTIADGTGSIVEFGPGAAIRRIRPVLGLREFKK